ncbi:MAG: hypothetical protein H0W21_05765 [Actinobacteria bacterium]|nr:hypothetical protein [Actinomycetota bacterium]
MDAEVVASVVAACPSVARLYGGRAAEVATYLPGTRVEGVRLAEDELEVHVVAAWDVPLPQVADEVRSAAAPVGGGLPVAVFIDDVDIPPALLGADEPPEDTLADPMGLTAPAPPGATVPGEVIPPPPVPPPAGDALPGDPMDPLGADPVDSEIQADLLLSQPEPATPSAQGDPAADVLPGEILPDDPVLEDEVPGDVIPGEPVTPPTGSGHRRKKRTSKKGAGGSR